MINKEKVELSKKIIKRDLELYKNNEIFKEELIEIGITKEYGDLEIIDRRFNEVYGMPFMIEYSDNNFKLEDLNDINYKYKYHIGFVDPIIKYYDTIKDVFKDVLDNTIPKP